MMLRLLAAGALILVAMCSVAQTTKIGYVNPEKIERDAPAFVRAAEALKKEFEPRNKQIADLQKQIAADQERFEKERPKLSPAELQSRRNAIEAMMRKSDQLVYILSDEVDRRKAERGQKLLEEVNAAVKAVAEAGKFDLIVQQATYAGPGLDITDQVIKEMAKRGGKP